jgi:hypothetical protein
MLAGCAHSNRNSHAPSPAAVGLNTNNLIELQGQARSDTANSPADLRALADNTQAGPRPFATSPRRSVLCLSAGGSYGAYSVGVLCGWTCRGDRPQFDVVTGISTGALIAPFAFLGPRYDQQIEQFFTRTESREIYRTRPVRGLFSESVADNAPLAHKVDGMLTFELMRAIAAEHCRGRRLYIGTTEAEGRRFVAWDIGEIASRGTARDRELIKQILLGSSAFPGFFPPAHITVTVNGQPFVEKHVDGGVSQSLFFRAPFVPPDHPEATRLDDTDVYAIVAGKLYADPKVTKPRALKVVTSDVSAILYAQARGDLQRLWATCAMSGMSFHMTAIRPEFPTPKSSTEFKPDAMRSMFNEGVAQVMAGTVWRTTPPDADPNETPLVRSGTDLIYQPRTPDARFPGQPSPIFTSPISPANPIP